jgi:hypothetical protein
MALGCHYEKYDAVLSSLYMRGVSMTAWMVN